MINSPGQGTRAVAFWSEMHNQNNQKEFYLITELKTKKNIRVSINIKLWVLTTLNAFVYWQLENWVVPFFGTLTIWHLRGQNFVAGGDCSSSVDLREIVHVKLNYLDLPRHSIFEKQLNQKHN